MHKHIKFKHFIERVRKKTDFYLLPFNLTKGSKIYYMAWQQFEGLPVLQKTGLYQ